MFASSSMYIEHLQHTTDKTNITLYTFYYWHLPVLACCVCRAVWKVLSIGQLYCYITVLSLYCCWAGDKLTLLACRHSTHTHTHIQRKSIRNYWKEIIKNTALLILALHERKNVFFMLQRHLRYAKSSYASRHMCSTSVRIVRSTGGLTA